MEARIARRLRVIGRSLVAALILVWIWFGVSSAWEETDWLVWLLHMLLPGGALLLTLLIALRWEEWGALLLLAEGMCLTLWIVGMAIVNAVPVVGMLVLLLLLGVPLVAAGGLLLAASQLARKWGAHPMTDER